jgi:hypothetical protein
MRLTAIPAFDPSITSKLAAVDGCAALHANLPRSNGTRKHTSNRFKRFFIRISVCTLTTKNNDLNTYLSHALEKVVHSGVTNYFLPPFLLLLMPAGAVAAAAHHVLIVPQIAQTISYHLCLSCDSLRPARG